MGRLINGKFHKIVPENFEEAHERTKRNVYPPYFEIRECAVLRNFLSKGADELFEEKCRSLLSVKASEKVLSATL